MVTVKMELLARKYAVRFKQHLSLLPGHKVLDWHEVRFLRYLFEELIKEKEGVK